MGKEWVKKHFSFINPEDDKLTIEGILDLARVVIVREGMDGLVIDPV